jgi:hypothetical protein
MLTALFQAAASVWSPEEVAAAVIRPVAGVAVAWLAYRLVRRVPWPRPFRARFLAVHLVAAPALATAWGVVSGALVTLVVGGSFVARVDGHWEESLFLGVFFYLVVAGVAYAVEGSARASRAEAISARTQLAALRAQLHPHFLFNALHTVVQLIPVEPRRAAEAAELVADLLRTSLEEQRDEVPLGDEWRFVSRYLAIERIRFGDRLVVRADIADRLLDERVPAFALQTLVENAVQHGAAPRVAPTEIVVAAADSASELTLSVRNACNGAAVGTAASGTGTGLARLRERLAVLHGTAASLVSRPDGNGGFEAVLVVPRHRGGEP